MQEPPLVNPQESANNPFAPTELHHTSREGSVELTGLFVVAAVTMVGLSLMLCAWSAWGVPAMVLSALSIGRAILLQRELSSRNYHVLPDATYLLFSSLLIVTGLAVAATIAFVSTCLPLSLAVGPYPGWATGILVGLGAFFVMVYASLKLPF